MEFIWKILEISKDGDVITHAKYHLIGKDDNISVETEGNWWFSDKELKIPFADVKETDIANWIEQEATVNGDCHIKTGLINQVNALKSTQKAQLPWLPQTFNIEV